MKYYFMVYLNGDGEIGNAAVDIHPMIWQKAIHEKHPGVYVLINWKEISEKEYLIFKEMI